MNRLFGAKKEEAPPPPPAKEEKPVEEPPKKVTVPLSEQQARVPFLIISVSCKRK